MPASPDYEYRDALTTGKVRGRGAQLNPGNRFENTRLHVLGDHLDQLQLELESEGVTDPATGRQVKTRVYRDRSRTILNKVNSPDLHFGWTINPYRGCEHGCAYCYARPDHEYLGMSSGLDFETRIFAKMEAPKLLRRELNHPRWQPANIMLAGDTDCYQPIERQIGLTRQVLEVLYEARQPVSIVTKNRLVTRDLDLLAEMARLHLVTVALSITTMDAALAAKLEPRASSPANRIKAVRELSQAGVPTSVMVAPVIPALNDRHIADVLRASADAGAVRAGYVLLRLPHQLKQLFIDWLEREFPDRAQHVLSLIMDTRSGKLYDARHGVRQRGEGQVAEQIGRMFQVFARKFGLDGPRPHIDYSQFRPPAVDGQGMLF